MSFYSQENNEQVFLFLVLKVINECVPRGIYLELF